VLDRGSYFNDLALLASVPRAATVVTLEPCVCFTLTRDKFANFAKVAPELLEALRKAYPLAAEQEAAAKARAAARSAAAAAAAGAAGSSAAAAAVASPAPVSVNGWLSGDGAASSPSHNNSSSPSNGLAGTGPGIRARSQSTSSNSSLPSVSLSLSSAAATRLRQSLAVPTLSPSAASSTVVSSVSSSSSSSGSSAPANFQPLRPLRHSVSGTLGVPPSGADGISPLLDAQTTPERSGSRLQNRSHSFSCAQLPTLQAVSTPPPTGLLSELKGANLSPASNLPPPHM